VYNTEELSEKWGQSDDRTRAHTKRRKRIIISIITLVVLGIIFLVLNNIMGLIFRPIASLNSVPGDSEWAMFGRNPLHTGSIEPLLNHPLEKVTTILTTEEAINSSPVAAGDTVYIGSRDQNLYAIDIETGDVRWTFKTGSWVESSPAVVDNTVYFGSNDGYFYAVDATTGQTKWDYRTKYGIRSSPAVADGKVYFGCGDYIIHCLDVENGKEIWSVDTGADIQSSPVVMNGILHIGTQSDYFYAINADNGRIRNKFKVYKPVVSSPAIKDGIVYFATTDGILYAFEGSSSNWLFENKIREFWKVLYFYGDTSKPPAASGYLWTLDLEAPTFSSPVIVDNTLYIGTREKLVAIDLQNQQKLWETRAGGFMYSTPAVTNGRVYAAGEDGHLYVFDANTGEHLQDLTVGGEIKTAPAIYGSSIYLSSGDGNLYQVN
jgi:outer membrane protein assembly factor BamB